jgi:FAD/FMN-containing dehydrogenase
MVLDVSGIQYVRVDRQKQTALVGAGANFAQVDTNLDFYGMHVPGGGCETVGVAGYMQGGGYSFTSLMFGLNCDNVQSIQMALADGRIITANAQDYDDLFWAVRGGTGNNFGVLLEVEYRLRELDQLWGFGFKWPLSSDQEADLGAEAAAVWQANFTGPAAPPNVGQQAALARTKQKPDDPDRDTGPYFLIRGMYNGTEGECRKALAPLFALIPNDSYRDFWRAGTYLDLNNSLLSFPTPLPNVPASIRSLAKSHIVDRYLAQAEWRTIIDLFRQAPEGDTVIGLEAYGGAINQVAPQATAFWHRSASLDVFLYSFWLYDRFREDAEEYLQKFDSVVGPLSNGHSYQNYPNSANKNFGRMYFGGNLPRLKDVKRKYDPADLFTFPQGLSRA